MNINRDNVVVPIIAGAIIIIAITFFVTIFSSGTSKKVMLQVGSGIFKADVALTESDRQKGLAGVEKINPDGALLMVFPKSDLWGIWMKDMKIPIDILWLDENKKVIFIVTNASPDLQDTKTFLPKTPARYVVEIPAGSTRSKAIKVGSYAIFDENSIIGVK